MQVENVKLAASILVERRQKGVQGDRLPEHCRPQNIEDAFTVQHAVTQQWCELMDDSVGAWKCSLPSPEKIVMGPIYTRTIDSIPPIAVWPKEENARIEPELAFFIGKDLPAREQPYSTEEIDAAIVRTHMALELINSRYALVNQGFVIGPQVDNESARNASEFSIHVNGNNGESREHAGKHPNGFPRAPLYWLVEFLRSRGEGLVAGQAVITGSYAGVIEVPLNTNINISYAGLGEMQVSFTARRNY
jgi:2-keto-4-pentenoate hydratase